MHRLKFYSSLVLLLATFPVFANVGYIPAQLQQYQSTGQCPNCDLSNAFLNGFANANLANAILTGADLTGNFGSSNFTNAIMGGVEMGGVNASGSNFGGANLTQSSLRSADFSRCTFTDANLTGADLGYANLVGAIITTEQLNSAKSLSCAWMPDGSRHPSDSGQPC